MSLIIAHARGEIVVPGLEIPTRKRKAFNPSLQELIDVAEKLGSKMALTYLAAAYAADMLGEITTSGLFMGLNSASPGTTGANELTPGTAYSGDRPAITWGSPSSGVVSSSDTQTFTLLSAQTGGIPYFSIWTADTSGTYITGGETSGLSGSIPDSAEVTFTSSITLTVAG